MSDWTVSDICTNMQKDYSVCVKASCLIFLLISLLVTLNEKILLRNSLAPSVPCTVHTRPIQ